jgi:hypothetical protein
MGSPDAHKVAAVKKESLPVLAFDEGILSLGISLNHGADPNVGDFPFFLAMFRHRRACFVNQISSSNARQVF